MFALVTVVTCARFRTSRGPEAEQLTSAAAQSFAAPSSSVAEPNALSKPAINEAGDGSRLTSGAVDSSKLRLWSQGVDALLVGQRTEPLRILWFGDSHAAADFWPNAVRKAIATEIPLAGPGYLALGVPNYRHGMARLWREGTMELAPHPPARRSVEDDGVFGLGGTRVTLKDSTAVVSLRLSFEGARTTTINYELYYRAVSGGDRLSLTVGAVRKVFGTDDATAHVGALSTLRFEASGNDTIEIRAVGGMPQLYGIVAETKAPGVVIDTLGINGARYGTVLAWDEGAFVAAVAARKPLVAVVAYGTNEVFDDEKVTRHAQRLEQVIERLRSAVPEIGCIVAGPTDVSKGGQAAQARVVAIDQAEHRTADRLGCDYFSPYDVMAADGGYAAWSRQDPPLALSDGIHLTARGYTRLGEALARQYLISAGK